MTCPRCHKEFDAGTASCPYCGARNGAASGVFQTSTVLISTEGADRVYRSVQEVPARLRNRLLKTTNGANSATILIADRKGRKEIDKAMRKLPGPAQRRLVHSMLGGEAPVDPLAWLTPVVRKWIAGAVALLAVIVVVAVFLYKSKG
jgi:hypothetical protein